MPEFARVGGCLKLGPRHAVWAEDARDWRGRSHYRYRIVDLPPGLIRPSPVEPGISDPAALAAQVRALIGAERKRGTPIALVLPDLCVRATLLEVDALPSRPSERDALIRWRLEKESAFPLSGAKVVTQLFAPRTVLAVAVRETVLRQYEAVCEEVGLYPAVVETAGFCLWSAIGHRVPAAEPVACLSLLDDGFTFVIHHSGRPAFLRTKVRSGSGAEGTFQDLASSLAVYAETHPQEAPRRLLLLSEEPEAALVRRATDELGLDVVRLDGRELRPFGLDAGGEAIPADALPAIAGLRNGLTRVNLGSRARSYVGAARAALALISLLLIGLIAWDLQRARAIEQQIIPVEQAVARVRAQDSRLQLQAQAEGLDLSDAALQRLPREVAFANQVIAKRVFSWTRFLTDLEEAVPPRVAIRSIHLDSKGSVIALAGSALTLKDLTALIISLEDHRAFQDAVLGQHRVLETDVVEFTLTVRYHSESRGG